MPSESPFCIAPVTSIFIEQFEREEEEEETQVEREEALRTSNKARSFFLAISFGTKVS